MSCISIHPWQRGPTELLEFVLERSGLTDDVDRRVSFLILDVGVETLFKTYLTLPKEVTQTPVSHEERRKFANGRFHDLIEGIRRAAPGRINELDLQHVNFYHDIRNRLYHQSSGLTVRQEDLEGYTGTAMGLLRQLLGVDLKRPTGPDSLAAPRKSLGDNGSLDMGAATRIREDMSQATNRLTRLARLFTERIGPRLIYPSTVERLEEIATGIDVATFPSKLQEFRNLLSANLDDPEMKSWLLDLVSDEYDIAGDSAEALANTQFIMELGNDPTSLYLFLICFFYLPVGDITRDVLWRSEDISFIDSDDYHILGIYTSARGLLSFALTGGSLSTLNAGMLERCREVLSKLNTTVTRMESLMTR